MPLASFPDTAPSPLASPLLPAMFQEYEHLISVSQMSQTRSYLQTFSSSKIIY